MRGRDIVRLPKTVTKPGDWKVVTGTSRMPPSAYRLSKRASYQVGRHWHWRVDEMTGGGFNFRVLTAYRPETEEFTAMLGVVEGDDLRIVARLEHHGDHPGLHCHGTCDDHEKIPLGDNDPYMFKRLPGGNDKHRRKDAIKTESDALQVAHGFFGVRPGKDWTLR